MKKLLTDEEYDFNFNFEKEYDIYMYAIYKNVRSKRKYKRLAEKYYTYDQWKNRVNIKYKNITLKSLYDIKRMLQRKLDRCKSSENGIGSIAVPIALLIMNAYLDIVSINNNILISNIVYLIVLFWFFIDRVIEAKNITKEKIFFKDYIELIDEMISIKKNFIS